MLVTRKKKICNENNLIQRKNVNVETLSSSNTVIFQFLSVI